MRRSWTPEEETGLLEAQAKGRRALAAYARKINRTIGSVTTRCYSLDSGRVPVADAPPRERVLLWFRKTERNVHLRALVRCNGTQRVEVLAAFSRRGTPDNVAAMYVADRMLRRLVTVQPGGWAQRDAGPRDLYVPFAHEVISRLPECCVIDGDDVKRYAGRELGGGELLERVRALGMNEHPAGGE
jgi:hypothetical protein